MDRRWLKVRKSFLRGVLPVIRLLPLPVGSRLVSGLGRVEYRLRQPIRQAFQAAVRSGGQVLNCHWDVPAVSQELAGNQILWRLRDLLLDGVSEKRAHRVIRVIGRDHLDAALAQGQGCLILTGHFGAHMVPAHWLYRKNYPVRLYMERPRSISRFMVKRFKSEGPLGQEKLFISRKSDPADSASSILRAARVVKSGMALFLAGDVRWSGQLTEPACFLGQEFRFSTTWVVLAALTGAPVVSVFCQMQPDGYYQIEFYPPFQVAVKPGQQGMVTIPSAFLHGSLPVWKIREPTLKRPREDDAFHSFREFHGPSVRGSPATL